MLAIFGISQTATALPDRSSLRTLEKQLASRACCCIQILLHSSKLILFLEPINPYRLFVRKAQKVMNKRHQGQDYEKQQPQGNSIMPHIIFSLIFNDTSLLRYSCFLPKRRSMSACRAKILKRYAIPSSVLSMHIYFLKDVYISRVSLILLICSKATASCYQ